MTAPTSYEILIAQPGEFFGHAAGNWETHIGDSNEFATVEEAEDAIKQLVELGDNDDNWHCLYAIRAKGQSSLIATYDYRDEDA